jgi:glycosyltransferase involved in cell wall biosynthesis
MDNISILIPTYNRKKFLPLIIRNILSQSYPKDKLELIIDDDGQEKLLNNIDLENMKEVLKPIKIKYIDNLPKRSIGKKRDDLIKKASSKIVVFMDDDDLYFPSYIQYSYECLKQNKVGCVGSTQMLFTMSDDEFKTYMINCGDKKRLIHEATLMMTKKFYRASCGFADSSQGEGNNIFYGMENQVHITDIFNIMCCIQHSGNTIDKLQFQKEEFKIDLDIQDDIKNFLLNILKIN